MYGEGKVEAMRRYAADHEIDLAQSWAYSDSASDLPMLRAVGNPVVVNPDAELAEIARRGRLAGDAVRAPRAAGVAAAGAQRGADRRRVARAP